MSRILSFLTVLIALVFSTATYAQDKAILVLDGSGSMWGQIDGEAKITIAQRVIADLLETLPDTNELGLIAYGHREKGVCDDIETLVMPGPNTRDEILAAVNAISPKGKTPLSAAVLAAAEVLKYEEDKATVILISDGRETCDFDPCALGAELEATGVDFTAHVVGFDVENDPEAKAQLQCLADNTGGRFLSADNASELSEALIEISAPPEPEYYDIEINARVENNGPYITEGIIWWLQDADGNQIVAAANQASIAQTLLEGNYHVELLRTADEATAELDFTATGTQTYTLELPLLLPNATVSGPESAPAGSTIMVEWTGPSGGSDYIAISEADSADVRNIRYTYTHEGSPLEVQIPAVPGDYEIRYYHEATDLVLARQAIEVTEVTATITAPDTADAGEELVIEWEGPAYIRDFISVAELGGDNNGYINYTYTRDGSPLRLTMPAETGDYEIRYTMDEGTTILASHVISVIEVLASITAPETAVAGVDLVLEWDGPDYQNDYLAVFEVNAAFDAKYINYSYTREGNPLRLRMPTEAGDYEIRYIQNQDKKVLATTLITLTEMTASIDAPSTGIAGVDMVIQWTGPDYQNDFIAVFEANAAFDAKHINYSYTREGTPLRLRMPTEPGEYEIRYIVNQGDKAIASQAVTLTELSGSLTIPSNAEAGSSLVIEWAGPDYQNDYIAIFPEDGDGRYINYTYTNKGNPLRLNMPALPGTYEIQYILNQDKEVLTSQTITIDPATATLTAPETGVAGESVVVEWDGPDNTNDYIGIFPAGDENARYTSYTYTNKGSPLRVDLPSEAGDYEIRYILNQGDTALVSVPITVE